MKITYIFESLFIIFPLIIGIFIVIVGTSGRKEKKTNCNLKVNAQLIRIDKEQTLDTEVYNGVYEYYVNGKKYEQVIYRTEIKKEFEKKKSYDILVNPNNPQQYILPYASMGQVITIIGLIMALIPMIIITVNIFIFK